MKIATIIGVRPQFIKAAVLSRLFHQHGHIEEKVIHTGQHYDRSMNDVFFAELGLPAPDYRLTPATGPQGRQTGQMLMGIEPILETEKPDRVLVYGDTNTTLAGALAAAKLHILIAHVEAGLRSFDRTMPEEVNRVLTDHLASSLFCPTEVAVANLLREGIHDQVFQVGDVMYDALQYYNARPFSSETLARLNLPHQGYALATLHRAGNTNDTPRFLQIWQNLNRLAAELPVLLPLHPRSRKVLLDHPMPTNQDLHVIEPVGYLEMLALERNASLIVTDSGGVQKEAYWQGVPCLTMRDNTEWTETVKSGWNALVGCDGDKLLSGAGRFLKQGCPEDRPNHYGDGHAGERIVSILTGTPPATPPDELPAAP